MTLLLALGLVAAGIAIIIGASDKAAGLARITFVVAVLAGLARCLPCWLSSLWPKGAVGAGGLWLAGLAALTALGWALWRYRAERARARELWHRRHGAFRARSLPPAPSIRGEEKR